METSLGAQLRQWRAARRLSLSELAARAGLSKGTLSGWEAGAHQPRLPELEALFTALAVPPVEQEQALALLQAPRAVRHLRSAASAQAAAINLDEVLIPAGGDLLRAMRRRRGLTLERVAAVLDVRPSTVSRWERTETWPSGDQLDQLCCLLEAHGEEVAVLSAGPFGLEGDEVPHTLDELEVQLQIWRQQPQTVRKLALMELALLRFEAHAWRLARRSEAAWPLLAQVYAGHADHLWFLERFTESRRYTDRALPLIGRQKQISDSLVRAVVRSADLDALRGPRPHPTRGMEILQAWQPQVQSAEMRAWVLSEIAKYASLAGQTEHAVALAARACRLAEKEANRLELQYRRLDQARVLVQCGRPQEALGSLPDVEPSMAIETELLRTAALEAMGNAEEAGERLQHATALVNEHPFPDVIARERRELAGLTRRLQL